jgi:hypothetical protein
VIAGYDQGAKTETPPAFHDFGAAIDENDFLRRVAFGRGRFVNVALLSPA